MALARARRDGGMNYWPGFVDVLSSFILGIIFLLTVFVFVQFYLTQEVTGKDTALNRLNAQIAQLTELLSLEKSSKLGAEEQLAQLNSNLLAAESERDRYKGLYEGAGSGSLDVQGKVTALSGALDAEKRISGRALAQVEVLNQKIAALRRQHGARTCDTGRGRPAEGVGPRGWGGFPAARPRGGGKGLGPQPPYRAEADGAVSVAAFTLRPYRTADEEAAIELWRRTCQIA